MRRRIVGFLIGLVISAVAFSMIAVFTAKNRMPPGQDQQDAKPVTADPQRQVSEPVRQPEPLRQEEPPVAVMEPPSQEVRPAKPEPVEPPVAAVETEPVETPPEDAPLVVAEPAPQPEPAPVEPPQPAPEEPEQQAPLQKPEVLTEAPPAPQPVAPVPNPPMEVAKAEAEPAPEPETAVAQSPEPDAVAADVAQKAEPAPVIRRSRLPIVSDDPSQSAGIQFGRPNTSGLPTVTAPNAGPVPAVPAETIFPETPAPVSPKRLVAPKSVPAEPGKVAILTVEPKVPPVAETEPRAIDKFGVLFDAGDKPTLSIILVDAGNAGVPLNAAATLDLPITFAVAVDRSDATLAAKSYYKNGHEVLALSPRSVELSLSGGQTAEQVGDLLTEFFRIVPQSVGLLDVPEATLQNDRVLSKHVLAALHQTGHGLVTYEQGLNVIKREADKAEVPAGLIYRAIDQKGETVEAIKRHLDRAAAEASRSGHVLVIGSTRADTIGAIKAWTQSRAAQNVALAPVSASIKQE